MNQDLPKKTKKQEPRLSIEDRLAKLEEDKKQLLKEKRELKKVEAKRALNEARLNVISWEKELCAALKEFFPDTPSELAEVLRRHMPARVPPTTNTKNGEAL